MRVGWGRCARTWSARIGGAHRPGEDVELLRREAQTPSFQAFAARAGLALPPPDEQGDDLASLQDCFRSASGLNSVAGLLSLFMLSGFVGLCSGIVVWMLALKPFTSKREMHDTFISDPHYMYPRTTRLLENLLDVIY